ncbi:hypothetical protein GALL_551260 [mine drainage metagenome]|uniref:Uncharacterized protein n=1 Tax=mine drainage metagenome TaxID=410659 RepID=A0A1J5NX49_9ZZZZ
MTCQDIPAQSNQRLQTTAQAKQNTYRSQNQNQQLLRQRVQPQVISHLLLGVQRLRYLHNHRQSGRVADDGLKKGRYSDLFTMHGGGKKIRGIGCQPRFWHGQG